MKVTGTADPNVDGGSFGPIGSTINELENISPEHNLEKELYRKTNVDNTSTILALMLPTHVWLSIQNSSKLPGSAIKQIDYRTYWSKRPPSL